MKEGGDGQEKEKERYVVMTTEIGDVTMVTELQGGSGAYSTDNVVVMVVHCASSKKKTKKRNPDL